MGSFTLFVTYVTQVIMESVQVTELKMNVNVHIAAQLLETFHHFCDVVLVVYKLFLAKKVIDDSDNMSHAVFSKRVIDSANCLSFFFS